MVMFSTMAAYSVIFPNAFSRIARADEMTSAEHTVQTDPTDGTVARVEIWKVSLELIRKNLFFGVGTGDVKDILLESYRRNGLEPVFLQKLNAHNQYFQTFIALGFFGFTLLALMLLIPAILALKHHEYLYFAFISIIAINLLFESMLENQAGVVFYAFFNVLLFAVIQQAKDKTTSAAL
jgi:O-antigen ligase